MRVERRGDVAIHVLPINDLREHEETPDCWCAPTVWREGRRRVIAHNSLDGRELVEEHGLQ